MYPETITNDRAAGILEIRWQDGLQQKLRNGFLREQCLCASCKSARDQRNERIVASEGLRVTDIIPVGSYAVQLIFSDGHLRGIFPWLYLRGLKDEKLEGAVSGRAAARQSEAR